MKIKNFKIGADIELFIQRKQNEIISAEGLIPGTKHEPHCFDNSNPFFAVSLDNVAAEFCIPPVNTLENWIKNIAKSRDFIDSILPKDCKSVAMPAAILDTKWLETENAQRFGCEPDYCVWTLSINNSPEAANKNLRSCGGHIHVGYDDPSLEVSEAIIKAMDLYLGVPSVFQEPDNERKLLYGKAGAFRPKKYGTEYRTISNYYMANETLLSWAYNATVDAINFVNEHDVDFLDTYSSQIQEAINENNHVIAQNLINQFELKLAA